MMRILITDDNRKNREKIINFLCVKGIDIVCDEARDRVTAQNMMKANEYDIVILDMNLGESIYQGTSTLSWMKRNNIAYPTIIISKSAYSSEINKARLSYDFVIARFKLEQFLELSLVVDSFINKTLETTGAIVKKKNQEINSILHKVTIAVSVLLFTTLASSVVVLFQFFFNTNGLSMYTHLIVIHSLILAMLIGLDVITGTAIVKSSINHLSKFLKTFKGKSAKH